MFWNKTKPAPAEANESSPGKRAVPIAATSALVALAILSGCGGKNGSPSLAKVHKMEAERAKKIERNDRRLNSVLQPAAVNLAERALKLSARPDSGFTRYQADSYLYPPHSTTVALTAKNPAISLEDSAYITMLRVNGRPDPSKVISVMTDSKLAYTKKGEDHVWKNTASITAPHIPHLSGYGQGDAWSGFGTDDPTSEDKNESSVLYNDTADAWGVGEKVTDAHQVVHEARFIFKEIVQQAAK